MNSVPRRLAVLALAVGLLTIWLYLPSINNGFVDWDDYVYLNEVAHHRELSLRTIQWAFSTVRPFYYHPLARLSHVVDYRLWGWNPARHHLTSVLLHGINAGLAVIFVWLLCGEIPVASAGRRTIVACVVGLVFGIHPLQVESVAWLAERKNLLCALFALICLIACVKAVRQTERRGWYWLMMVAFIAALLSKPMAVALPFVMLALDFYPLRRHIREGWRELLKEKVLMIALCAAVSMVTVLPSMREGGVTGLTRFGVVARSVVAARSLVFYLWKLVWPRWLSPYYPLEGEIPIAETEYLASAIAVIAITACAFWQRKRAPAVLAAWAAYVALILPVSGLAQTGAQAAGDRFMYLAMLAPLVLAGWVWVWAVANFRAIGRGALIVLAVSELAFFGYSTRGQIGVWRDDETLWQEALACFPNSGLANAMMANALVRQNRFEEAAAFAQRAVQVSPGFWKAHATLGLIALRTGRYPEAVTELTIALRDKPELATEQYSLACALSRVGRAEEALMALDRAVSLNVDCARWAAGDADLDPLRSDPIYSDRFRALIDRGGSK